MIKKLFQVVLPVFLLIIPQIASSQEEPVKPTTTEEVPDWAKPASATHQQVSPPSDYHRDAITDMTPLGIFDGQSDVGAAIIAGSSTYDADKEEYTITSAGYNVWYVRDEFRYVWKKMSGDVSLAAEIEYPDAEGYGDRKAVFVIRQNLEDDSKEALVAKHGAGMIHLAWRPEKGVKVRDMEYRIGSRGAIPGGESMDELITNQASRIGIEKKGDFFSLWVSLDGEPMHQFGAPIELKLDGPFYVGIGFCSHVPDKADTAVISNVALENEAGKVR